MSFLVCSATLKLPTPNPCDLAHTQAIESFSKAPLFPNIPPPHPRIITEPVKQVYHDGHKCDLIIQSYFRRSFKSYIFSTVENIFTYSFFPVFWNNVSPSAQSLWNKLIIWGIEVTKKEFRNSEKGEKAVWCKRLNLHHYTRLTTDH